jgi:hypothetical protein
MWYTEDKMYSMRLAFRIKIRQANDRKQQRQLLLAVKKNEKETTEEHVCKFCSLSPTSSEQNKKSGLALHTDATVSATDAGEGDEDDDDDDDDDEQVLSSDTGGDDCRRCQYKTSVSAVLTVHFVL